jgi:probable F420-dependent oxidoreductase
VRFGYILPNYGNWISAQQLVELARACEEAGFDSVWATDHIIVPTDLGEPYGNLLEPLITLASIASATERVRVGTSCIVLPQRNPILLAKQAAALDVFSKGRVILGVGAGWAEPEFRFLNADFGRRGKVMDESIRLMKCLWRDELVGFDGEFFHVKDALFLPKPINGDIPVWIGGNGPTAISRTIRLGDGWHPVGPEVEGFRRGAEEIRNSKKGVTLSMRMTTDVRKKRAPYAGANNERRVAVSGSPADVRKEIEAYAKAGLEYYCASINHPSVGDIIADLKLFSDEVVRSHS